MRFIRKGNRIIPIREKVERSPVKAEAVAATVGLGIGFAAESAATVMRKTGIKMIYARKPKLARTLIENACRLRKVGWGTAAIGVASLAAGTALHIKRRNNSR